MLDLASDRELAGVERSLNAGDGDREEDEITSVVGLHHFRSFSDIISSPWDCREENLKMDDR